MNLIDQAVKAWMSEKENKMKQSNICVFQFACLTVGGIGNVLVKLLVGYRYFHEQ